MHALLFDPRGDFLLTATGGRGLLAWPLRRAGGAGSLRLGPPFAVGPSRAADFLAMSAGGAILAVESGAEVDLYRREAGGFAAAGRLGPLGGGAKNFSIDPDGRWLALGAWQEDGAVVFALDTREKAAEFPGHSPRCAFSPDGRWLVVSQSRSYDFYRTGTWEPVHRIDCAGDTGFGNPMNFNAPGDLLAVAPGLGRIALADPATGEVRAELEGADSFTLREMAMSADGGLFAMTGQDGSLRSWDLRALRARLGGFGLGRDLGPWGAPPPGSPPGADPRPLSLEIAFGAQPGRAEHLAQRSRSFLERGDLAGAAGALEDALELPDARIQHRQDLERLRRHAGACPLTYRSLDAALEPGSAAPGGIAADWLPGALRHYLEGRLRQSGGRPAEAAESFAEACRLDPGAVDPALRRAECLLALGRGPEAIEVLGRRLDSDRGRSRRLLDRLFQAMARDPETGLKAFLEVISAAALDDAGEALEDYRWLARSLLDEGALRIDAGKAEDREAEGGRWHRDRFFLSGHVAERPALSIEEETAAGRPLGEADRVMLRSERWFASGDVQPAVYSIPLPPGRYRVTLHFAEIVFREPGRRVFGVQLEDEAVAEKLDLAGDAGFARPHLLGPFDLEVQDGALDLRFREVSGSPRISGIEIIAAGNGR